ncbi:MAG: citrate transporter [Tatlockia sp.]|nr:citrate transporter [Tatlockia sp.]
MLALLGWCMIITFMYLILSKRLSGFCALVVVPILFAILSGYSEQVSDMMLQGIIAIAPTAIMMLFAVTYFGIMMDVGLFDPLIIILLKKVHGDPLKIVMGTTFLAMIASLEGEGAVVFMVVCSALLPLYRKLNINPVILAVICSMDTAVKNMFPWSAPGARVLAVFKLEAADIFHPLIPVIIVGYLWVLFTSYILGKREQARLGIIQIDSSIINHISSEILQKNAKYKRPQLFSSNLILTLTLMLMLMITKIPILIIFLVGTALALILNFPVAEEQRGRMVAHAKEAFTVSSVVFAAGIFLGILTGTKMTDAMANSLISIIPSALGIHMGIITAVLSAPLSFFLSNDAFYFGILPVLNHMATAHGISSAEIGRASLMGTPIHMLSPLVATLWLLVGLCKISFGDLQKGGIWWCLGLMLTNIITALAVGAFSL